MPTLADLQGQRQQYFKQRGEQAQGQIQGETEGNVGALQRRFTSMGAGNTGAALAAEQTARDHGLAQQRQAMTDIGGQQLQAGEGDIGRAFQSEQTQQAQGFAAEQARLGRDAQLGEAEKGRGFQRELSDKDIAFKTKLADTEQGNKLRDMDLAYQQFQLDKDTTAFNQRMAELSGGSNGGSGKSPTGIQTIAKEIQGVIPTNIGQGLVQTAVGTVASQMPIVKDIARRIGIKW